MGAEFMGKCLHALCSHRREHPQGVIKKYQAQERDC
jgi:hypothetical protein